MLISRRNLCLGLSALALTPTPARGAGHADWRSAIGDIRARIETIHPNAFFHADRDSFRRQARALESALPRLNEHERMVRAMQLVGTIGDGHTQIEPMRDDFRQWYGVRLYQFTDGYFVTSAFGADADLAGAQILEIAGRPAAEVIDAARSLMGADNPLDRMERLFAVHNAALMHGLGFANSNGELAITARLAGGNVVRRTLAAQPSSDPAFATSPAFEWRFRAGEIYGPPLGGLDAWRTAFRALPALAFRSEDRTRPLHLMYRRGRIAHAIPSANTYYMQVHYVGNLEGDPFAEYAERALREVDTLRPDSLIVDLRYAFGGDGSKVPGFIHAFIRRGAAPPWRNLYVLTGRRTFSAGVMMIAAFVDHTPVTFIGEPAGGALDHYGDAVALDVSSIGAQLYVSTLFHQLQDQGQRYDIMPVDVAAPFSFAEFAEGRDPAIDPILRGEEMRSISAIALADGGAAARRTFDHRRRSLAAYNDWMHLREFDLTKAIWRLSDLDRRADAVELAHIMVALRPNSARAHALLGDNLLATDQREAGLDAYEASLRLDPFNLDNISQRRTLTEAGRIAP